MTPDQLQQYLVPALFIGFFAWRFLSFRLVKARIPSLLLQGGVIVDVRSTSEYANGFVPGSLNIPLSDLAKRASKLDKSKPVILCCASGSRSGMGAAILKRQGFTNVINGGPWTNLRGLQ